MTRLKCTFQRLDRYDSRVLIFAMDEATKTTIVYIAVWFIGFPAIVTGLIAVAIVQTLRERSENQHNRLDRHH